MKLTKQEYIDYYQKLNHIILTDYKHIILACDCGKPKCKGWVVLNKQGHTVNKFK
jgi:hypothetical protein